MQALNPAKSEVMNLLKDLSAYEAMRCPGIE
jgi:hypothetical protein